MTKRETEEKREEIITIVWGKMVELAKSYTYDKYREITDIISDWNSEHYDDDFEIFMCDDVNERGERIGLYLEDDHVIFED